MADTLESLSERVARLEDRTKTQLLDTRFIVRAFAVYGHCLAVGLIIGGSVMLVMMMFSVLFFLGRQ